MDGNHETKQELYGERKSRVRNIKYQISNIKYQNKENYLVVIDRLEKDKEFKVTDGEKKIFVIFLHHGKNEKGDIRVIIEGKKAEVQILGIILGFGKSEITLSSLQDHVKPNSSSDLLIRSALFDKAEFHYKGLIRIEKGAQNSKAYQKNQNLLYSGRCRVDSKPYLEILANNVFCKHAVTIGKIDEGLLYYLATRGLNKLEATKLLLTGFFQEVLERIPDEEVKKQLGEELSSKISKLLK